MKNSSSNISLRKLSSTYEISDQCSITYYSEFSAIVDLTIKKTHVIVVTSSDDENETGDDDDHTSTSYIIQHSPFL